MKLFSESTKDLKNDKVLDIINDINSYNEIKELFTEGFCFDFTLMLWRNIPGSEIIFIKNYDGETNGHYVLKWNENYYDINGEFKMEEKYNIEKENVKENVIDYLENIIKSRK